MTISPTGSYWITLPDEVFEDKDDQVASFWIDRNPLLLQLSSVRRKVDDGFGAHARLEEKMDRLGKRVIFTHLRICSDQSVNQAFSWQVDANTTWLHGYLVWPHLPIYVTISGPEDEVRSTSAWVFEALRSIHFNLH